MNLSLIIAVIHLQLSLRSNILLLRRRNAIDPFTPFASFACKMADNCDNSRCETQHSIGLSPLVTPTVITLGLGARAPTLSFSSHCRLSSRGIPNH